MSAGVGLAVDDGRMMSALDDAMVWRLQNEGICAARSTPGEGMRPFLCSLDAGHAGGHVAHGPGGNVFEAWSR